MRDRKKARLWATIVIVVVIAALVGTYVLSIGVGGFGDAAAHATETDELGGGVYVVQLDENGNPVYDADGNPVIVLETPETEEEIESKKPSLTITSFPPAINVGEQTILTYESKNLPPDTIVYYESSDPNVATVSDDGTVTAVAPGEAWVCAIAGDVRSLEVLIKVSDPPPQGISIACEQLSGLAEGETAFDIKVGAILDFSYKIQPANARPSTKPAWTISNPEVAEWDASKRQFLATAAGETDLTVSVDGVSSAISFRITENENIVLVYVMKMLPYIILIVVVIVAVCVVVYIVKKERQKREKRALAKFKKAERERLEAEQRQRAQAQGGFAAQPAAQAAQMPPTAAQEAAVREKYEPPFQGQAVGATGRQGDTIHPAGKEPKGETDRPFTLDDIE
ncbi:MAG: Ig-like domain-containing protein [Clostridiales Family XIII bacterium]|jgi:hypothetical protein|nr:Ig-like domain-containing protein [Clostridiales Family XIII bacterium]